MSHSMSLRAAGSRIDCSISVASVVLPRRARATARLTASVSSGASPFGTVNAGGTGPVAMADASVGRVAGFTDVGTRRAVALLFFDFSAALARDVARLAAARVFLAPALDLAAAFAAAGFGLCFCGAAGP